MHRSISNPHAVEAAKLLESKYYEIVSAHNDRQFDRDKEPWVSVTPSFKSELAYGDQREVDLEGYLETGRKMFGGDPSLRVEVQDVSVNVDEQEGFGEVFANQTLVSPGVISRSSVVVATFKFVRGEWKCCGNKHIKGLDFAG